MDLDSMVLPDQFYKHATRLKVNIDGTDFLDGIYHAFELIENYSNPLLSYIMFAQTPVGGSLLKIMAILCPNSQVSAPLSPQSRPRQLTTMQKRSRLTCSPKSVFENCRNARTGRLSCGEY